AAPVTVVVACRDELLDQLVGLGVVRESSAHAHIMPRASDMRAVRPAPISRTHAPKSRNGSSSDASGAPPDDTSPTGSLIWAPRSLIWDHRRLSALRRTPPRSRP